MSQTKNESNLSNYSDVDTVKTSFETTDHTDELTTSAIEEKYDSKEFKEVTIEERKSRFKLRETNFIKDPKTKEILYPVVFNKSGKIDYEQTIKTADRYAKVTHFYPTLPRLTGMPRITRKVYIRITKRSPLKRMRYFGFYKTPKECDIRYVVNFPFTEIGAPPITALGQYRMGKSNLLSFVAACWIARRKRFLIFDDMACETRTLAYHGYFDKNSKFHPFKLVYWIPKGYKFRDDTPNHNPIWNHRKNCSVKEFIKPEEITENMKPGIINIVYTEAFTEIGLIKLWIDLMIEIVPYVTIHNHYVFMHHEFADMVPESPRGELASLVDKMFYITRRLPKWRIAVLTSFHDTADVSYKISRKYTLVLQKRSVHKKNMTDVELAAKNYKRKDVAISIGGNWRPHKITLFPELPEIYKLIPNRAAIDYPDFMIALTEPTKYKVDIQSLLTETEYNRYIRYVEHRKSMQQIAKEDGVQMKSIIDSLQNAFQKIHREMVS